LLLAIFLGFKRALIAADGATCQPLPPGALVMARCNDQKVSELIRRDVLRAGERDESEEKGYCFHRHEKRHALRRARSALGLDAFEFEIDVSQRRVAFAPVRNHHASHFFQSSRCQFDVVGRGGKLNVRFHFHRRRLREWPSLGIASAERYARGSSIHRGYVGLGNFAILVKQLKSRPFQVFIPCESFSCHRRLKTGHV